METPPPPLDLLDPFEKVTFQLMDGLVRHALPFTEAWLRTISVGWMTFGSRKMMVPLGLDRLAGLSPEQGILLVSNHRSFSDLYMLTLLLHRFTALRQPVICPVRADFFYQRAAGVAVNLLVGGGRMYPPFFREASKQPFNRWSLDRVAEVLRGGRVVVGFHPEGRRNKNQDPYEPLPAQPGVGKLVMATWPVVVPAFIHGLSNDIVGDIWGNIRGRKRVVAVFGAPMDLTPFRAYGDRLSSHKRIADALLREIYRLGEEERAYRASL
jgi:1-acyl-sn-glycerol-3-phosphate acyltransferase